MTKYNFDDARFDDARFNGERFAGEEFDGAEINYGKIQDKSGIYQCTLKVSLVRVYLVGKDGKLVLIKYGDAISKNFSLAGDYLDHYNKTIKAEYAGAYEKKKAQKNLIQDNCKLLRVCKNKKGDKIPLSSATKNWQLTEYRIELVLRDQAGKVKDYSLKDNFFPGIKKLAEYKEVFYRAERKIKRNEELTKEECKLLSLPIPACKFIVEQNSAKSEESISPSSENLFETSLNATDDKENESFLESFSSSSSQNSLESISLSSKQFSEESSEENDSLLSKDISKFRISKPISRANSVSSNSSDINSVSRNSSLFSRVVTTPPKQFKPIQQYIIYQEKKEIVLPKDLPKTVTPAISFRDSVRVKFSEEEWEDLGIKESTNKVTFGFKH